MAYFSKNNLASLQGVQQFGRLRVLSAADNLLADMHALQPLAACAASLQVACFDRNPVTSLPNYRAKVLALLPHLQTLDGQVRLTRLARAERERGAR